MGPSYPVQFDNLELLHTDTPCDFNGDTLCRVADIRMMVNQGDLVAGVSVGAGNQFDLNSDNTINEADITEWLDLTGTHNGYGSPMLRGDTDGLGNMSPTPRTVDITDFQNFLNDFTGSCVNWECATLTATTLSTSPTSPTTSCRVFPRRMAARTVLNSPSPNPVPWYSWD